MMIPWTMNTKTICKNILKLLIEVNLSWKKNTLLDESMTPKVFYDIFNTRCVIKSSIYFLHY